MSLTPAFLRALLPPNPGGKFEEFFPGITHRVLGATPMFWMPGARELSLWMGAVDASRASAERCIRKGHSLTVYPGGCVVHGPIMAPVAPTSLTLPFSPRSKEIFTTDAESKVNKLTLKSRKGFVKLAMRFGCDLVPGECALEAPHTRTRAGAALSPL